MKELLFEIMTDILMEQNGYTKDEATEQAKDCEGSEIWNAVKKTLTKRIGKSIEFTEHISKLEKGCAPSVSLMDTRIDIAKKAIEMYKAKQP